MNIKDIINALRSELGANGVSEEEKNIAYLYLILNDLIHNDLIKKDLKVDIKHQIMACMKELEVLIRKNTDDNLKQAIEEVNILLANLEENQDAQKIIQYLQNHHVYKMLYHKPKFKGEEIDKDNELTTGFRYGFIAVGVSAVFIALFAAVSFLSAPIWATAIATGLFVGSLTYLSGITYGVVNDFFAVRMNLAYFLLGHKKDQKSLLRSNDKIAQSITWGVGASANLSLRAAIIFALVTSITAFFLPIATFVLPVMMIAMPFIALFAEHYAQKEKSKFLNTIDGQTEIGYNEYQISANSFICPNNATKAAYLANGSRNRFGFTKLPLIGLGTLIGMISLSSLSAFLPPLLFMPLLAVIIPVVLTSLATVLLTVGGIYAYSVRNTQTNDDRYALDFEHETPDYTLYLEDEEDKQFINTLINSHMTTKPNDEQKKDNTVPQDQEIHHFPPVFSPSPEPPPQNNPKSLFEHYFNKK